MLRPSSSQDAGLIRSLNDRIYIGNTVGQVWYANHDVVLFTASMGT
jgi:hypothetical protein